VGWELGAGGWGPEIAARQTGSPSPAVHVIGSPEVDVDIEQ
jgi:hypothetical protein